MTCTLNSQVERKVWRRLRQLAELKSRGKLERIGLLGCMAEKVKGKLGESLCSMDIVAGPDSYRALPKLLAVNRLSGQKAVNVMLSLDETYADVMPGWLERTALDGEACGSAFVSISRGCNQMCSFCVVPYTRGRERSRATASILKEVITFAQQGKRQLVLLGQNVNSYRDLRPESSRFMAEPVSGMYRIQSPGVTFAVLLDEIAQAVPEVRIRFTSSHAKDLDERLIRVMAKHANIAKALHLPAQSGSDAVLQRMHRGYTKHDYLHLLHNIRDILPDIGISGDLIAGFCGETDDDHRETIDLMHHAGYCAMHAYAYCEREKTASFNKLLDDVPHDVKMARLAQLNRVHQQLSLGLNRQLVGQVQLVLLEGVCKHNGQTAFFGHNHANHKVILPLVGHNLSYKLGDFLAVKVVDCTHSTLIGEPLEVSSIPQFYS